MAPGAPQSSSPRTTLRGWVARHVYGLGAHADRLRQPANRPRLLICPSRGRYSGASMFRAYYLVDEMRRLGWRCTLLPVQMNWRQRERLISAEKPGLIYLQQCRDPMTQPGLYKRFAPTVLDIDDADYADPGVAAKVEQAVRDATLVVAGSDVIASWCRERNPRVEVVWTSHPPRTHAVAPHAARGPVLAWVQVGWQAYREECAFVREVVLEVARQGVPGLAFHMFDAGDEAAADAFVAPLRAAGVRVRLIQRLPNHEFLRELEEAAVGIHVLRPGAPYAHGKSFGKVLSYLVAGVAIVASDPFETARFLTHERTAWTSRTPAEMAAHARALLLDAAARQRLADSAYAAFLEQLATPIAARRLDAIFRSLHRDDTDTLARTMQTPS